MDKWRESGDWWALTKNASVGYVYPLGGNQATVRVVWNVDARCIRLAFRVLYFLEAFVPFDDFYTISPEIY